MIINKKPILIKHNQQKCDTLFETIKVQEGKVFNLEYHQKRVDNAYKNFYNKEPQLNLKSVINPLENGLYRCKVIYNQNGLVSVDFFKYKKKEIKSIMLIENSDFNYSFKYTNREFFESLYNIYRNTDEFIITKEGYLQDFTIGNIALYHSKKKQWHTPSKPLLFGTTLMRYIDRKKLQLKDIHYTNLENYSKIALLNAMVDFYIIG